MLAVDPSLEAQRGRAARRPGADRARPGRPRRLHPLDGRRASGSAGSPPRPARRRRRWRDAFDVVVIETVGVGQSETDVAEAADTVAVVVQPGSGDALQFLKAGIMEVPDVLVVTKADLGAPARRAEHDLRAALGALGARGTPVVAVSSLRTGDAASTRSPTRSTPTAPGSTSPPPHPHPPPRRARRLRPRARRARPARARRPPRRDPLARRAGARADRARAAPPSGS